jgi:hypothetical protein
MTRISIPMAKAAYFRSEVNPKLNAMDIIAKLLPIASGKSLGKAQFLNRPNRK